MYEKSVSIYVIRWDLVQMKRVNCALSGDVLRGESLPRGPKLLSMYTVEQRGFLIRKYWQTCSFKARQTAFRTEFGEGRAPSNCCIQKRVKKLETRGSRSNVCRIPSLLHIEGHSVQK